MSVAMDCKLEVAGAPAVYITSGIAVGVGVATGRLVFTPEQVAAVLAQGHGCIYCTDRVLDPIDSMVADYCVGLLLINASMHRYTPPDCNLSPIYSVCV